VTDTLKKKGQPLPPALASEWDDKRDAAWTPARSLADWRCPQGHRYQMTRAQREASLQKGVDPCPHPKHAKMEAALGDSAKLPLGARSAAGTAMEAMHKIGAELKKAAATSVAAGQTVTVDNGYGGPRRVAVPDPGPVAAVRLDTPPAAPGSPQEPSGTAAAVQHPPAPAGASKGKRGAAARKGSDVPLSESLAALMSAAEPVAIRGEFLVRDLLGRPAAVYEWVRARPSGPAAGLPQAAHHAFVLDRSGSMYSDIGGVRDLVQRLLAVEEYRRPDLLVSIVSYSSRGALLRHVERQRVEALPAGAGLAGLRADGLTCVSDGLRAALDLARPGERTTVTLHSDGWANDPDPGAERAAVLGLCGRLRALGAVVNTVAHRQSSDFAMLAEVANAGGGSCVQAGSLTTVYDALALAHRGAVGPGGSPVAVPAGFDYAVRLHPGLRRVQCLPVRREPVTLDGAVLEGVSEAEGVYFVRNATAHLRDGQTMVYPSRSSQDSLPVMLALARGLVGAGRHALAKQVALSTGYTGLRRHARALTGPQVAALAADLEDLLLGPVGGAPAWRTAPTGLIVPQPDPTLTLPELLALLGRRPGAVRVFLPALLATYTRRGVKRVPGKWEGGAIVEPAVYAVKRRAGTGADGWVDLVSVEQNDAEATVNVTLAQPIDLVRRGSSQAVGVRGPGAAGPVAREARADQRLSEVAGVSLEGLRQYRSFTVVGDGEPCVKSLPVRVTDEAMHADLRAAGALPSGAGFSPSTRVDLSLDLPLLRSAGEAPCPTEADVVRALRLSALQRLLSASLRDGSGTGLSAEQVAALKAVHVTPSLHFSPPTCYPYADLHLAQAQGRVDSRTRYRVLFGALGLLGSGDLPSANEFLQRRFACPGASGAPLDKPTMRDFFDPACAVREKTAAEARRLKPGPVDGLLGPLYSLALERRGGSPWPRHALVSSNPADPAAATVAVGSAELGLPAEFGTGAAWSDAVARRVDLHRVERALEEARRPLREAVMAVGAAGQVPDSWGPALDANAAERAGYRVGKSERGGTFRLHRGVLACVVAEESLYSVSFEGSSDADPQ